MQRTTLSSLLFLLSSLPLPGTAATPEILLPGTWENRYQGDLVGLQLQVGETCELYLERALQKRSTRACRYVKLQGESLDVEQRFQIFLKNAEGQCGTEPDFEFIFETASPLIRLQTGNSEVLLQKISPAP
jgi:hypothetical protein